MTVQFPAHIWQNVLSNMGAEDLRPLRLVSKDFFRNFTEYEPSKEITSNRLTHELTWLSKNPSVQKLSLRRLPVTNELLQLFPTHLQCLRLGCTDVTSEGAKHIASTQTHLEELDLGYIPLQDTDFLLNLSRLKILDLRFTKLPFSSIKKLSALKHLQELNILGLGLKDRLEELEALFPHTRISL